MFRPTITGTMGRTKNRPRRSRRSAWILGGGLAIPLLLLGCTESARFVPWPDAEGARAILFLDEGLPGEAWLVEPAVVDPAGVLRLELPDGMSSKTHALLLSCEAEPLLAASLGPCAGFQEGCVRIRLDSTGAPLPPASKVLTFGSSSWTESVSLPAGVSDRKLAIPLDALCARFSGELVLFGDAPQSPTRAVSSLHDGRAAAMLDDGSLWSFSEGHTSLLTRPSTTSAMFSLFARNSDEIYALGRSGDFFRTDSTGQTERLPTLQVTQPINDARMDGSASGEPLEIFVITLNQGLARFRDGSWTWIIEPNTDPHEAWMGVLRTGPGEVLGFAGFEKAPGEPVLVHAVDDGAGFEVTYESLDRGGSFIDPEEASVIGRSETFGTVIGTSLGRILARDAEAKWIALGGLESRTRIFTVASLDEGVIFGGKFKSLHEYGAWSGGCSSVYVAFNDIRNIVPVRDGYLGVIASAPGQPATTVWVRRQNERSVCGRPL